MKARTLSTYSSGKSADYPAAHTANQGAVSSVWPQDMQRIAVEHLRMTSFSRIGAGMSLNSGSPSATATGSVVSRYSSRSRQSTSARRLPSPRRWSGPEVCASLPDPGELGLRQLGVFRRKAASAFHHRRQTVAAGDGDEAVERDAHHQNDLGWIFRGRHLALSPFSRIVALTNWSNWANVSGKPRRCSSRSSVV